MAEALRGRGWRVHWLGAPGSMEEKLVPPRGFAFEPVQFGGVRGKGPVTLALLPMRLLRAFWQSLAVVRRVRVCEPADGIVRSAEATQAALASQRRYRSSSCSPRLPR